MQQKPVKKTSKWSLDFEDFGDDEDMTFRLRGKLQAEDIDDVFGDVFNQAEQVEAPSSEQEEFQENETPQLIDKVIRIIQDYCMTGNMSKSEYQTLQLYVKENSDDTRHFINKLSNQDNDLGEHTYKMVSILKRLIVPKLSQPKTQAPIQNQYPQQYPPKKDIL